MTQSDPERGDHGCGVEERLARARVAFDQGLREATAQGARTARRLLVPALWGAALVGGTLLALALLRMLRHSSAERALLRVTIEPKFAPRPLLPALGGAVARLALHRLLAVPSAAASSPVAESPGADLAERTGPETPLAQIASSHAGSSNGRAKA